MHQFMGRGLEIFNCPSVENLPLFFADLPFDTSLPSRVLNRQIKHSMQLILSETTRKVLHDLEKQLRLRSKAAWVPCFSCVILLCICIEEIIIAIDGFVLHKNTDNHVPTFNESDMMQSIRRLEDFFIDLKTLFHEIYRSAKDRTGPKNERAFNPVRDGIDVDEAEDLTEDMRTLVKDIHRTLDTCGKKFG